MSRPLDLAVVGGGIVGLATALQLLEAPAGPARRHPREGGRASRRTRRGHNSGVLHAGLYYTPGSLKARLCREGKAALEAFATENGIPFERCGKLVVALDEGELERFDGAQGARHRQRRARA